MIDGIALASYQGFAHTKPLSDLAGQGVGMYLVEPF